jgi:photosystem I reaction center subunit V
VAVVLMWRVWHGTWSMQPSTHAHTHRHARTHTREPNERTAATTRATTRTGFTLIDVMAWGALGHALGFAILAATSSGVIPGVSA